MTADVSVEPVTSRRPTLASLLGLGAVFVGIGIGAQRLGDNSFLTHLATGREMLDSGIVRNDVFTWTSPGEPIVVQSWLASFIYAVIDDLAGFHGLRLLMVVLTATIAGLAWLLTERAGSLENRVLIMAPTLLIGLRAWTERPLLFAFVLLALTLVMAEGRGNTRWLVLVGIIWVNVHGSWPLGLVLLGARWFGARLDRRPASRDKASFAWLSTGLIVGGVLNPYGPAMLVFPLELLGKRDTLRFVSEWQASSFQSMWTRAFLLLIVALVVAAKRAGWQLVLPAVGFAIAALLSARNIPVAAIVLLPTLAGGLPAWKGVDPQRTSSAINLAAGLLVVVVLAFPLVAIRGPHVEVDRYPVAAVDAMEDLGLGPDEVNVIHQDFVGNYLDLRYGAAEASWIDDRFELHEHRLVLDYVALLKGESDWAEVLDHYQPAALLWQSDRVLVELATSVGAWVEVWSDDEWSVLCPADSSLCQ